MDQADGLRELARAVDAQGVFASMGLPAVFDARPTVDKAKLWDDFKALLEFEAGRCVGDQVRGYKPTADAINSRAILDRMEQAETLARFKGGL